MSEINPPGRLRVPGALIELGPQVKSYEEQRDFILFQMALRHAEQETTSIIVREKSNLPVAVDGTHTLRDLTVYAIEGVIDLEGDTITYGFRSSLLGRSASVDGFETASTGALLNGSAMRALNLSLNNIDGAIFNKTDDATGLLFVANCITNRLARFGVVSNSTGVIFDRYRIVSPNNPWTGLLMEGFSLNNTICDCLFVGYEGKCIDLDIAVINTLGMDNTIFSGLLGSFSLAGLPDSENLITRGVVRACSFNGDGEALSGITKKDIKWVFAINAGLTDSRRIGSLEWVENTVTMTSIIDGTYIPLELSGVVAGTNIERFIVSDAAAAQLEFIDDDGFDGTAVLSVNVEPQNAQDADYRIALSINGEVPDFDTASYMPMKFKGTELSIDFQFGMSIESGDTVQFMVAGDGTENNLTFGFGQQTTR